MPAYTDVSSCAAGFTASLLKFHCRSAIITSGAARSLYPTYLPRISSCGMRSHGGRHADGNLGVGVGDASASPTTALLLSILQESTGRIATIVFADRLGTSLEPECKMYRLAADVFNDAAMLLDCLSPALPRGPRVLLLSSSSMLRALCGVAAGSSKASLSAHFAKWGNLGELNAVSTIRCCRPSAS